MLVTGAHGFVAGSVLSQAGDDWQVHALSRSGALARRENLYWHRCDPLAAGPLGGVFREIQPQVVIHPAAIADIDFCETQRELVWAVNVEFTRRLAALCAETGARLVFCSTDTIFDGRHAPYREEDPPGPVNFYAETKVEGEKIVSRLGPRAVIARLSLVMGLPVLGSGNSFLVRMIADLRHGRTINAFTHEVRTPIDVLTAGKALLELAAADHHGIFHLAGHSRVNRFEMARLIADRFGFSRDLVVPLEIANRMPGRAARPLDVSLDNGKACARLQTPMRTLEEGLSLVIEAASADAL